MPGVDESSEFFLPLISHSEIFSYNKKEKGVFVYFDNDGLNMDLFSVNVVLIYLLGCNCVMCSKAQKWRGLFSLLHWKEWSL